MLSPRRSDSGPGPWDALAERYESRAACGGYHPYGERRQRFYESEAWVIMPNYVHQLILRQVELPRITDCIKGRTARDANRLLGRAGAPFWQHESYDHG